ncbi:hypothetical protein, partial [Chryseobacterium gambrini]|uniref:hypothetical protein n=1 Tax=Chryseobacterium gambrini TaxID=373672 RepID=UPI0025B4EBA0
SVLLPTAEGPHAAYAAEVAGAVARSNGATVEAFRVLPENASEADRDAANDAIDEATESLTDVEVERTVVERDDIVSA